MTGIAHAEEPLATDRPDFVEASTTVGAGRFQIETSVALEKDSGAELWATPTLLRFGLGDRWELRVETDGYLDFDAPGVSETGMADTAVGVKYHVADRPGRAASLGWLFHVDLPSGSDPFKGEGLRPSLRFVAEWELPQDWSAGVMPGVIWDDDGDERYVAGIFGVVFGKSFSDRLRGFVEFAASQIASDRHGGTVATGDVGLAYLINNDLQIDAAYNGGLTNDTADHAWTVGLSARF